MGREIDSRQGLKTWLEILFQLMRKALRSKGLLFVCELHPMKQILGQFKHHDLPLGAGVNPIKFRWNRWSDLVFHGLSVKSQSDQIFSQIRDEPPRGRGSMLKYFSKIIFGDYFRCSNTKIIFFRPDSTAAALVKYCTRVARWFVFKPKIPIWVNFGGP
jgi:hypothetical protein